MYAMHMSYKCCISCICTMYVVFGIGCAYASDVTCIMGVIRDCYIMHALCAHICDIWCNMRAVCNGFAQCML